MKNQFILPSLSRVVCGVFALLATGGALSAAEGGSVPEPWKHQDVGAVEVKGDASFAKGVFTLKGTLDTWGTNDGFHFVYQSLKGDGQIVARVVSVENTANHAKAGVMFRESVAAEARQASTAVTPVDGVQFLHREEKGGKTTSDKVGVNKGKLPYWVKLVRAGDKFTGYESLDGKEWTQTGTTTVAMGETALVGLVTSSHQKTVLCTGVLDNVSVGKGK